MSIWVKFLSEKSEKVLNALSNKQLRTIDTIAAITNLTETEVTKEINDLVESGLACSRYYFDKNGAKQLIFHLPLSLD
ncbi:hypothetical protein GCM10008018_71430 [Paenibacillus marchantiophytorum]|uniref:MarR family transcriptional regulator n=1 Tax=Paenibacillus marchantiophytorum TaxID=1619310 RepID=A0ABQ1FIQ3_9BACL|nr:hypothetical protein [Paenibacillus marchantiophytorum]GGA16654.1 hypothetical protein GCM10008018_71430 [Paenibacillus marchantiophytorum]